MDLENNAFCYECGAVWTKDIRIAKTLATVYGTNAEGQLRDLCDACVAKKTPKPASGHS